MSNPTSNFGWQMPTPTDLVTDLPADFEVFGQAVDTSLADLKGGTSGQILAKNSNTDMDFVWVTNDVGDITAVTAGTGISGGGTSGAVTITNSMATTITTAGDVIYGTGSGTFTRLGIGTANQVLTVNSGATAPEWQTAASGGGMTLLSTTTLSGATTTISSINQTYTELAVYVYGQTNNTGNGVLQLAPNNEGTSNVRAEVYYISSPESTATNGASGGKINFNAGQVIDRSSANNAWCLRLPNYASTASMKPYQLSGGYYGSGGGYNGFTSSGLWYSTAAISSLVFNNTGGNFSAGTVLVYGVK